MAYTPLYLNAIHFLALGVNIGEYILIRFLSTFKRISYFVFLFLGISTLLFAGTPAQAQSPTIKEISFGQSGNVLTLNAQLENGFNERILDAIDSGVPMTFTYHIELRKVVSFWKDQLVSSADVRNTVQYDSLKNLYRFSVLGKNVKRKIITRDKSRYKNLMLSLKKVPIASIYKLNPNEEYYLRVKADMETDRFWFPFNYIFFFVPFNDFDTSWAESSVLNVNELMYHEEDGFSLQSRNNDKRNSRALNHVIRSFNQ